jgi:holo-[acyl-carrier protein] synthase
MADLAMFHIGVDLVEIDRIQAAIERWGKRFTMRVYTPAERAHCRNRTPELAARFAAKEAVMKALGTGIRGVGWREIEVLPDPNGKPLVYLYGGAQRKAKELGLRNLAISLSHSREYAIASVIGDSSEDSNN